MQKIYGYRNKDKNRWGIAGDISIDDVEELLIKQNYKCYVCKDTVLLDSWTNNCLYQFSIDRINEHFPHDRDNFLISCYHCNCEIYIREDAEKKICIYGCHTEEKIFKSTRRDELPNMEHFRLSRNADRDIQLKTVYEKIYENKKIDFERRFKIFRKNTLKFLLEKRIIFQRLFIMFQEGTKQIYAPTNEFMNELYNLRISMYNSMHNYVYMSNATIRPFDEWYMELQTKRSFEDRCRIEISPKNVSIDVFDETYETRFKSKLKKKIEKEFLNIYKRGEFEINPIHLIAVTGLDEYFSFNYYSDLIIEN